MLSLFQDSTDILPHYVNVHPYGVAVYSVLVSLLVSAVVFLWRKLAALETQFLNLVKEGAATLATITQRLEDQQEMKEQQTQILAALKDLKEKFDKLNCKNE